MTGVDAVVVAYESADRLERLLPRVFAESAIDSVVVVDHGNDGSADVARAHGASVIIDPSNPGFGAGQNNGVAQTTASLVLLINPDLEPVPGAVTHAVAFFEEHPGAGAVQGVIRSEADGAPERSAGRILGAVHLWGRLLRLRTFLRLRPVRHAARRLRVLADHVDRGPLHPVAVESLAATMLLVRREAFDSVGGFDESFFLYGEDLDLCVRLRAAGWTLWSLPPTWAHHASGESSANRWGRELVWWEGTMRFAALHWTSSSFAAALAAASLRALALAVQQPPRAVEVVDRLVLAAVRSRRRR